MRVLFGVLVLLGVSQLDALSQDRTSVSKENNNSPSGVKYCVIDTILTMSDGSTGRIYFRSSEPAIGNFFSTVVHEFDQAQRQIVNQYSEESDRLMQRRSQWLQLQAEKESLMRQEFRTRRIALFTEIIGLTSDEAQRFWPVYNDYTAKKDEILLNRRFLVEKIRDPYLQHSPKEAESYATEYVNSSKLESDLTQDYFKRFKSILPPNKLLLLYRAEEEFKISMLRTLRGTN